MKTNKLLKLAQKVSEQTETYEIKNTMSGDYETVNTGKPTTLAIEAKSAISQYLAEIGRKGGQKSRRKLTKAQARAMVRARTAKRARLRPNGLHERPGANT